MKKFILLVLALTAFLSNGVQAQDAKEVKAWAGESYATTQGSYTPSFVNDGSGTEIRNVILMIGDGMGSGAVNAAMYANGGELTMTNLKTMGYVRTQSADNTTTDSAASGTAYATGVKTNNGYLGVAPDLSELENLPEKLARLGYISGVVSTDDMSGATPAAFFAHQSARGASGAIWADLAESVLSFASAGTEQSFQKLEFKTREALEDVFDIVFSAEDAEKALGSDRLLYLPETVATGERGDYLPRTTRLALEYLSAKADKGFFLMVEGARIDKQEHNNSYDGMVEETLDFDKAVEEAIRFAEKDRHTLVIISADHETGAVTLTKCTPSDGHVQGVFASRGHSPMMVPLFAYGPHSREFSGVQENSDVSNKIFELLK